LIDNILKYINQKMLSYSQMMNLMKRYNDLKKTIESKEKPLDSEDKDVKEFNNVIHILSMIQKQMEGGCSGGCCGHHH
jgi:hypothetical protein